MEKIRKKINFLGALYIVTLFIPFAVFVYPMLVPENGEVAEVVEEEEEAEVVNGIEVTSGLIYDDGYKLVATNCGACHSLELVTQNAATREGWIEIIRWMQETQGLWDLGDDESIILDYLSKNYAPKEVGRRPNLENIEWYDLEI